MNDHQAPNPFPAPEPPQTPRHPSAQLAPASRAPVAPKRRTGLIATGTGVLGLIAGLLIGSSGSDSLTPPPAAAPTSAATATVPSATAPQTEATEPASAETTTASAGTAADAEGTRQNPFVVGEMVANDEWEITLGVPKESWKAIKAENQFNDPAPEGMEFYMVPVEATYIGDETGIAWVDLSVRFVGDDGVTYSDSCGVLPDNLNDVGELYKGGTATGNTCVTVPQGAEGLWTLTAGWGDPVFFIAEK